MKHLCEDCHYCKRIIENLEGYPETSCCKVEEKISGTVKKCKDYCSKELFDYLMKMKKTINYKICFQK